MSQVISTAEPFFFPGGPIGVMLVHGFTGSPKEMRWMGEYLAQEGFTVLGIRLPGHATRIEDIHRTRWPDWLAAVEDGYHLLQGAASSVYVCGLSMGGALSLLFAASHPVRGVIAMSTPHFLSTDWRLNYAEYFVLLQPRVPKGPPDWRNPDAALDHVDYPYYPTRSIIQVRELLKEMRQSLPRVKAPTLLIHSRTDTGVPPENMELNYALLGSPDKRMLWVEDSGHVITREPERQGIFRAAADFMRRVEGGSPA
jgi:carboxylesterase